jgi:acetyl-CoA acyltransferase
MGLTAENLARKYEITREQADEFSLQSHQKAAAAIRAGNFKDELVPITVHRRVRWEGPAVAKRSYSTPTKACDLMQAEGFAKLKSAFLANGTVTAGNSSQMSDGAAAAVVMADKARWA